MGPVTGSPVVDYANDRVYVASFSKSGSGPSLWCAQIGASGTLSACAGFTSPHLGHVATSPVLRRGRLYVSNSTDVYSVDAATGAAGPPFSTRTDGAVKGFLFPDRRNDDLHFATNSSVWSVADTAGSLSENWRWDAGGGLLPSPVLHWPDTDLLYVGSQSGTLYELDFTLGGPPAVKSVVLGDGSDHVGAPSLDVGVDVPGVPEGKKLLLVGSESGVLYAVEVPLP
jgi:hypothetical protein